LYEITVELKKISSSEPRHVWLCSNTYTQHHRHL